MKWTRLDYNKHKIMMYKGYRDNSVAREPYTVAWIETFLKEDVFYDVGANVGAFTLISASRKIKTVAFEPHIVNFHILLKNIMKNKFGSIVSFANFPLSDNDSFSDFNYSTMSPAKSSHTLGDPINARGQKYLPVFTIKMPTKTIDTLVGDNVFIRPNHIKIDVDGYEYNILKGATETLKTCRSILVENDKKNRVEDLRIHRILNNAEFILSSKESNERNLVYRKL